MTLHIKCGKDTLMCTKKESKIQSVPFKVYADCDAEISNYFEPYVKYSEDKQSMKGSFRGYPLNGKQIILPKGYVGVVLHENIKPLTETEDRNLFVVHNFKSFCNWNWDKEPSMNDKIEQVFDWIEVAEALHSPISLEEP